MTKTFIRPVTQIKTLDAFDDQVAAGASLETGPVDIETFTHGILSQLNRILHTTTAGNDWFAAPAGRGLNDLETDLADIEGKKILCRANLLTDITVGASDNFVVLSVSGSEAPSEVAAVALTQDGAVVAQSALSGAGFAAHELTELGGPDALHPKNLLLVRDATTGNVVQSGGKDVFGLLQYESTGVDGAAFNDTSAGNRAKISFVISNAGLDDLVACPAADIQGKTINYSYTFRINFDGFPEDCFLSSSGFIDQVAALDVTLDRAIDNQIGAATQSQDIDVDIGAGFSWEWRDAASARLVAIVEGSAGGTSELEIGSDVDLYDNNAVDVDYNAGVKAATGSTPIHVGVTPGVVETTGANDLRLLGGGELFLDDSNQPGSWAQVSGIKLSEDATEWTTFENNFGEVSILNAINQANAGAARVRADAEVTANIPANTLIKGPALASPNLDADLVNYDGKDFVQDVEIFIGGELMRNGADASSNHDVYPSTVAGERQAGAFFAEFLLKSGPGNADQISMFVNG